MLLNECNLLLDNFFSEKWIKKYNFSSIDLIKKSVSEIYSDINLLSFLIYDKLNHSVLCGEYLDTTTANELLDKVLKFIDSIPPTLEEIEEYSEIQSELTSVLLFQFITPLKTSIREYKSFINKIERNLKINEHSLLFDIVNNPVIEFKGNVILELFKLNKNFLLNIRIATIDHNLSVKKEILNELLVVRNEIENAVTNFTQQVLIEKCNYLIKKLLYRFKEDSKNYLYAFDFEDKELLPDELDVNVFNEFDDITKAHYEISHNHNFKRKKWINNVYIKRENNEELNFKEFHTAIKEYKDGTKNSSQIENLAKEFKHLKDQRLSSVKNQFDKKAWLITYNYIINNCFSFLIEQNHLDDSKIIERYGEIKNIQQETRIFNYFPCVKYAYFLISKIELLFKAEEINSINIAKYINLYENAIKDSFQNYEWCKDRNFLAFQLPQDESKIFFNFENNEYSFFLSSSFVLPINYEKILVELKEFNRKLEKYKTLYEVHENLKNEKRIINQLKVDIEKNDKRSIEILGIFSAVVLFTSSSVQIFSIEDVQFKDALKFMLCFSYSLTLFIFLIWLITRENIKSVTTIHKIFFYALTFVAIVSLLFVLNWWPFN
jgi:hypothetical protein